MEASDLIARIICSHPFGIKRNLQPAEISPLDCHAVIDAALAEMKRSGSGEIPALEMILERTRLIADQVPRHRWRFIRNPAQFYRNFDYRLDPEDFMDMKGGRDAESEALAIVRRAGHVAAL